MKAVQTKLLANVNDYLSERLGLHFSEKRFTDLERGLALSAEELEFENIQSCIDCLLANELKQSQLQTLVRNLTIGETYFFRDPSVFLALEEKVLPELLQKRGALKQLRIWSAGCSTGEEPYSIAMCLIRSIANLDSYHLSLRATDINTGSLEKAKRGFYGSWSFRTTPADVISAFFDEQAQDGQYRLQEQVRKRVQFDYLNLAEDDFPSNSNNTGNMDIVFCRNVLIYFNQKKCREIANKLSACLNPGGYLVSSANDAARFISSYPEDLERVSSTMFKKKS